MFKYSCKIICGNIMIFAISCISIFGILSVTATDIPLTHTAKPFTTGSAPFDTQIACTPLSTIITETGKDACKDDYIVRTNDTAVFLTTLTAHSSPISTITVTQTVPAGATFVEIPTACGANSVITNSDTTLTCYISNIEQLSSRDIYSTVLVGASFVNGSTVTLTSTVQNAAINQTTTTSVIVSAKPTWDIAVVSPDGKPLVSFTDQDTTNGGGNGDGNGANQNTKPQGILHTYPLLIQSPVQKGIEKTLSSQISFTIDLSQMTSQTELYTWGSYNACKDINWDSFSPLIPFSNNGRSQVDERSADSGTISCSQSGSTISVQISNINTTLQRYPIYTFQGVKLSSPSYIAASFALTLFTPFSDIPSGTRQVSMQASPNFTSKQLSQTITYTDVDMSNNTTSLLLDTGIKPSFDYKLDTFSVFSQNYKTRDGYITPNEYYEGIVEVYNYTPYPQYDATLCVKLDASMQEIASPTRQHLTLNGPLKGGFTVEYGRVNAQNLSDLRDARCDDVDATGAAFTNNRKDGDNVIRINLKEIPEGVYAQFRTYFKTKETANQFNTKLFSFGSVNFSNQRDTWWTPFDACNMNTTFATCDYATLTRTRIRTDKKYYLNYKNKETQVGIASSRVFAHIGYTYQSGVSLSDTVTIVDTLPPHLEFEAMYGGVSPSAFYTLDTGHTVLVWNIARTTSLQAKHGLYYTARVKADTPNNTKIEGTSTGIAPTDMSPEYLRQDWETFTTVSDIATTTPSQSQSNTQNTLSGNSLVIGNFVDSVAFRNNAVNLQYVNTSSTSRTIESLQTELGISSLFLDPARDIR